MKKFSTSIKGYSKEDVNEFVREVTKEYESMLNKLKERDIEIENLKSSMQNYKNIEDSLSRAVAIAEDSAAQIKKAAREEAKSIVDDSKRQASRILNDALLKADKVEQEAIILKRRVVSFKKRFKAAIEEQIDFVDNISDNI